MTALKNPTQASSNAVVGPNSTATLVAGPHTVPTEDRIRERAYELYESRGREPGLEEQDWFHAETELLQ